MKSSILLILSACLMSACVAQPRQEKGSVLNYLNGEYYQSPVRLVARPLETGVPPPGQGSGDTGPIEAPTGENQ